MTLSDTWTSRGQDPTLSLPAPLREALRRDSRPVRPLLSPAVRTLFITVMALAAIPLALGMLGLRPDDQMLGPVLLWVPAAVRIAAGGALILLAMREGIPGLGAPAPLRAAALLGAPVLLVLLAQWVAAGSIGSMPMIERMAADMGRDPLDCFPREIMLAVPGVALLCLLLARAHPVRPGFAAAAGALGAGLIVDAALHLICPFAALGHTLLLHGGALAGLTAAAAGIGCALGRRRFGPAPSSGAAAGR
jgi:hypothetical protein